MDNQGTTRKRRRKSRFSSGEDQAKSSKDVDTTSKATSLSLNSTTTLAPTAAVSAIRKRVAQSLAEKTTDADETKPIEPTVRKRRRLERFQFTETNEEKTKADENGSNPTSTTTLPSHTQRPSAAPNKSRWGAPVPKPPPPPLSKIDLKAIPTGPAPTLRINRTVAQKRKVASILKVSDSDLLETDPDLNPYHDPAIKAADRKRSTRAIKFLPQGEISAKAEILRQRATVDARRFEYKNQLKQEAIAGSDIPVLPPLAEDIRPPGYKEDIPECEWWDLPFVEKVDETAERDDDKMEDDKEIAEGFGLRTERITHYIHHPVPILKASEKPTPPIIPLKLTKKETKRLRRQRRKEEQLETQEKIAIGLLPPPKPRVKLNNLMRVLANEATADPTKVEEEVRTQIKERQEKHQENNEARKLSKEERKQKEKDKVEKDKDQGLHAVVFRVLNMKNPSLRFKVSINAKQLSMTGTMVVFQSCNVVVVEGGAKAIRKYKKLMLRRINWKEATEKKEKDEDKIEKQSSISLQTSNDETEKNLQPCALVWEGAISCGNFEEFSQNSFHTERLCRKHFREHHVEHYWDLCMQASPTGNDNLVQNKIE